MPFTFTHRRFAPLCLLLLTILLTSANTNAQEALAETEKAVKYRNSSFRAGYLRSNLDEMLVMSKSASNGFQLGYEYAFGKQYHLSSGLYFQQIAGTFEKIPEYSGLGIMGNGEAFLLYGFKVPVLAGYRAAADASIQYHANAGLVWHSGYIASHAEASIQGYMPRQHALAFSARTGVGYRWFFVEMQYEYGLTKTFRSMREHRLQLLSFSAGISF